MNLSGLSYLQFSLVDGFVLLYLFLRIHGTQSWPGINPFSVLRASQRSRGSGIVAMIGFYCCVIATALFLAKDGIMANQELQDVALCRSAVYLQEKVTPLDSEELPGIKKGLVLWDIATGFHLLALGCVMCNWASAPLRQLLGKSALMNTPTGLSMLGLGGVGLIAAIVSHIGAFNGLSNDPSRARSVSRMVTTIFFLLFLVLLLWVVMRITRTLKQTLARDPAATVSLVSAAYKLHNQPGYPMATLHYLLGMQMLSFMNNSTVLLCIVLFLRILFFLVFDISYLTPSQTLVVNLAENNTFTGIATLASSLVSVLVVQILFPYSQGVLVGVLSKVADFDPGARFAFIDGQPVGRTGGIPVPKLDQMSESRDHSFSNAGDATIRSRAPTTASLAVEKMLGNSSIRGVASHQVHLPVLPNNMQEKPLDAAQAMPPFDASHHVSEQRRNYLDLIPYIDRNTRENSFFSQGPWTQPVTQTLSPNALSDSTTIERTRSNTSTPVSAATTTTTTTTGTNPFLQNQQPQAPPMQLEELVRSNTGVSLISADSHREILRNSNIPNTSLIFDEDERDGMRTLSQQGLDQPINRSQVTSAFIPLSSSNLAFSQTTAANKVNLSESIGSNLTQPSNGQSLHAEVLQDSVDSDRPDSIVSAYIRPDNSTPMIKRLFNNDDNRPSSYASTEQYYEPMSSGNGSKSNEQTALQTSTNPFEDPGAVGRADRPTVPVYVANISHVAEDTIARDMGTPGPILIRKGSKASLRRKGTLERRRKKLNNSDGLSSANSSLANTSSSNTSQEMNKQQQNDKVADSSINKANSAYGYANSNTATNPSKSTQTGESQTDAERKKKLKNSRMSAFSGAPVKLAALLGKGSQPQRDRITAASRARDEVKTNNNAVEDPKRDSSTISSIAWNQPRSKHASEISVVADSFVEHQRPARKPLPAVPSISAAHRLSHEIGGASLPSSLFKNSVSSIGSRQSNDVYKSFSSMHTTGDGRDAFYTPDASIAQIIGLENTQETDPNALTSLATGVTEERPSTAPTSSNYRHTLGARRVTLENEEEDGALGRIRRAQTLRKPLDTDALAIESSIQVPTSEETTDALISALPMPEPPSRGANDRVIL
ncbi:hypothetical protein GGI25_001440 [Coemansia spiralis]|uniref:Uncharacterized protein n=2 Tax=Coemansia TaxID=4863 RepID=A0A9W8GCM6_9FUNG|nr:hypothetical protein EDC05_001404 [Coemansia umbellata]KAJ2624517.1 hypothetical protein GGI26_001436 [Coemansia sp. RSA 1358]KAJ2679517.1 hypothetical protein GGI25_001440 [Coemansia spiralis]